METIIVQLTDSLGLRLEHMCDIAGEISGYISNDCDVTRGMEMLYELFKADQRWITEVIGTDALPYAVMAMKHPGFEDCLKYLASSNGGTYTFDVPAYYVTEDRLMEIVARYVTAHPSVFRIMIDDVPEDGGTPEQRFYISKIVEIFPNTAVY